MRASASQFLCPPIPILDQPHLDQPHSIFRSEPGPGIFSLHAALTLFIIARYFKRFNPGSTWNASEAVVCNAELGTITYLANPGPRQCQLAVKIEF